MRVPWVKILCILVILCAVLTILEAKKSKRSKRENKNKQKPDKGRPQRPGKNPSYTEPVEITEKTELDSDSVQQKWPEKHLTQSTLSDDSSKDSDEDDDDDNDKKKKKKATVKAHRTTTRPPLRTTTTRKVFGAQNVTASFTANVSASLTANVTASVGANVTANWRTSTAEINATDLFNSSRDYGSYQRPDNAGHMGRMGHMPCATGHTKYDKVEKDITALWGYVQGITQPVHVHVHNKDGDMEVDRSPRGHSEKKYSKPRKEREEKGVASKYSKKGMRTDTRGTYRHLSHQHSRHPHDHHHSHHDHTKHNHTEHNHSHHEHTKHNHTKHNHSHHDHTKHNHTEHNHSHHEHTKHNHTKHNHSHHDHTKHNHTKHNHSHHDHTKHNHTKHNHSHHHHTKHHHAKDSHSHHHHHHHTKDHHTYHGHQDQHHTKQPDHVIGRLGLSKLGKGRETHIHIHIHVNDKGDKQNKGDEQNKRDEHHQEETPRSEQDVKPLYATCDLRNHDPKHNISGTISLRQKPGQQLEVRIQVQGFSVPLTDDVPPSPDEGTWPSNSSAVANETVSRIPVVSQHGFHVHEYGDFSQGCLSFGGHFNPEGVTHGHRNGGNIGHVGDWGNIDVDASGQAFSNFEVKSASLSGPNSIIGRGIVIHARADDLGEGHTEASKTTGDAGGRIACCTVAWAKPRV
ncbi:unnamed protein product [Lymnaea stagnalis]|uniref:Superoxide dismutase copper/zinc binding domain-containing protein n=1 Tax=Lymnaea stagnalis TaxID=6523 RepID=A0AAV2HDT5_LYMST